MYTPREHNTVRPSIIGAICSLWPKSGTAKCITSRPTFKSGSRPTEIRSDATGWMCSNRLQLNARKTEFMLVWYGMSSRRIWMLKLILLLIWVYLGPTYPKMSGFKFSDPLTPSGGPLSISGPLGLNPRLSPQVLDGF